MTDRRFIVGAVALVPGRVRGVIPIATRARDEVEALLPATFFEGAPFQKISLILRYGQQTNLAPEYQRRSVGILPIAVELEMNRLRKADPDEVHRLFRQAMLEAVIAVAEKYGLPRQDLYNARGEQPAPAADAGATQLAAAIENYGHPSTGASTPAPNEEAADELAPTDITIEYQIKGFGSPEDLQKRHDVEDLLDRALQQAGAGAVVGGEIGSGSMSVFCESDDPAHAVRVIRQALADASLDTGATVQVGE